MDRRYLISIVLILNVSGRFIGRVVSEHPQRRIDNFVAVSYSAHVGKRFVSSQSNRFLVMRTTHQFLCRGGFPLSLSTRIIFFFVVDFLRFFFKNVSMDSSPSLGGVFRKTFLNGRWWSGTSSKRFVEPVKTCPTLTVLLKRKSS